MNKAELSKLLEEKVQEKVNEGYSIPTYAMDVASRDRVKRALHPQSHAILHENHADEDWQEYLKQVEEGTYEPGRHALVVKTPDTSVASSIGETGSSSAGLWKARRH